MMKDLPASKRVLEIRRIARVRRIRLIVFICILFFSVFFALSFFSFSKKLTINNIEVSGNRILESNEIKEIAFKKMEGKYFYLFSRANFLLVPQKQIYKELLSSFPRIEKLSISRHGLNTLKINLTERTGIYLYCGEKVPEISKDIGDNCFYVNADGFIFDKAPYFSGNIYFKFYKKLENKDQIKGQNLMPKQDFQKLTSFVDGLIDNSFKPNYLIIEESGQNTMYLNHKPLSTQPHIIFKSDNDLSVILNNLSASMKKEEFKNQINSKYDKLLYIDLRFKNKVLYKFNDEQ